MNLSSRRVRDLLGFYLQQTGQAVLWNPQAKLIWHYMFNCKFSSLYCISQFIAEPAWRFSLAVKLTSQGLWGIVRLILQGTSAVVNQLDAISSGFRCKEPSNAVRLISSASYLCRSLPSGSCYSPGCDWAKEVSPNAPGHMRTYILSLFSTQKTPKITCLLTTILAKDRYWLCSV